VVVGTALAWTESGRFDPVIGLAAVAAALLIQIGTNLHNDAADFERGADTERRVGPARATAQGWFSASEVKRMAFTSFSGALLTGLYLASVGGWPIILIGLLSLTAGYAYTGGPRPIAYSALGELFVFLFFGLTAVLGSYYLQNRELSLAALYTACGLGSLAAAVLLVNNYRDLETDGLAGKLTLVHYLGRNRAKQVYALLLLLPFALPLLSNEYGRGVWLILTALPAALYLLYRFSRTTPGRQFNRILAQTAQLQIAYGLLLCVGLLL